MTRSLAAAALCCAAVSASAAQAPAVEARARALHARIVTVDTHSDTAFNLLRPDWNVAERHDGSARGAGRVDLPRMVEGGLDAEFFAAFVGQGPRTPDGYAKAKESALKTLEAVHRMTRDHADRIGFAETPDDALRLKKEGRLAAFTGLENGYPLGLDPSLVAEFRKLGVRYITLVHSSDNDLCDSSTDRREPEDRGLSDLGREVVRACNRAGVMVDVSHASDKSFFGILEASAAPVIASHSCCRAVCDNPRNLGDDMIRALAAKGGVVQICFLSAYVKPSPPNPDRDKAMAALREKYGRTRDLDEASRAKAYAEFEEVNRRWPERKATVKDLVNHVDHVKALVGIDFVGIGTDFDGGGGVEGCDDVSGMIRVTEELLRRGYSDEEIEKVWSGNIFRVFRKAIELETGSGVK